MIRLLLALVLLACPVYAAEQLDLTTPIQAPSVTSYRVIALSMVWPTGDIAITLADPLGGTQTFSYTGADGVALMQTLNTANLSVKSLHKRILEKLVADGKLTGTVSGTP